MIFGNKKDAEKYLPYLNKSLKKALLYIEETDFSKIANGEYEIDGRDVFARVNTYATEPKAARRPEKHEKYIDVQYVAVGEETIWYTSLTEKCVEIENKAEKEDVIFYADPQETNCVTLKAGDFAIFFPWELHRPNCSVGEEPANVQKIVVKVHSFDA